MIAVDTNMLVRVVTNDDRAQARRALRRMQSDRVWISRTVLLETAWVLRHAYGLDGPSVGRALATLANIPSVELEDHAGVLASLGVARSRNGHRRRAASVIERAVRSIRHFRRGARAARGQSPRAATDRRSLTSTSTSTSNPTVKVG